LLEYECFLQVQLYNFGVARPFFYYTAHANGGAAEQSGYHVA